MARTFKELMGDVARQQKLESEIRATERIQILKNMPATATDTIRTAKETMTTRIEILQTTLEAKTLLHDRLLEEISDEDFAYRLAQDPNLRKSVQQLTQQVLQPTPVEHIRTKHGNPYLDIGAGVSAFWETIKEATPIELAEATEIENILMSVEAGLDQSLEPDTRKSMLFAAGLTGEQVQELVPLSDYVNYETHVKEQMQTQIQMQLGLSEEAMKEERNQLLLESLTEDTMMHAKLQVEDPIVSEPTYEDLYGMSAQTLYEQFGDPDLERVPMVSGEQVPMDDALWSDYLNEAHALDHLQELYAYPIEEHEQMLQEYETFLADEVKQRQQEEDLPDFSDALAAMSDFPPQEITEADLAALDALRQEEYDIGSSL